jgi:predicted neuraminidase
MQPLMAGAVPGWQAPASPLKPQDAPERRLRGSADLAGKDSSPAGSDARPGGDHQPATKMPIYRQFVGRPFAHCATLTVLPDESLLAAWFAGSYETAPDVAILAAQYDRARRLWSPPRVIADVPDHSLGQPVFLSRPKGELWLFFVVITDRGVTLSPSPPGWASARPYWQRSLDYGHTWANPQLLLDYPGLMFRSRPLILPGRIILPMYDENTWESRMLISDDDGQSWALTAPIDSPVGNIHPTLVQLPEGRLLTYLRPGEKGGVIWRTESLDGGETWSQPTPTLVPNPNSGFDLLRLQSGRLALAFNNSDRLRTPLCVALAQEDEHWHRLRTLEDAYAEFSYPSLAQTQDGLVHVVYTYRREHIHYACFTENWLQEGKPYDKSQDKRRDRTAAHPL